MKENSTAPVVGDKLLEGVKTRFFEVYGNEKQQVEGIVLWPAKDIEETFKKATGEIGGEKETAALKAFYLDMVHFLRMGTYITRDPEEEEIILAILEGAI